MIVNARARSSMLVPPSAGANLVAIHHWAVAPVGMPELMAVRALPGRGVGLSCCAGLSANLVVLDILARVCEHCLSAGIASSLSAALLLLPQSTHFRPSLQHSLPCLCFIVVFKSDRA